VSSLSILAEEVGTVRKLAPGQFRTQLPALLPKLRQRRSSRFLENALGFALEGSAIQLGLLLKPLDDLLIQSSN
jgi:hypothetical protein